MMGRKNRRGFTLVETVVSVGIVAALAAVVYPQVVRQFDSADPTRAAEDLNSIRVAIETFGVNVKLQQPHDIEDLTNQISTLAADDLNARGTAYTSTEAAMWLGPYLNLNIDAATAGNSTVVMTTGFDGVITNRLSLFDPVVAGGFGGDTVTTANYANAIPGGFIAVKVMGLSAAGFNAINELIDGPQENTVTLRRLSGRFRCPGEDAPGAAADTACTRGAFYLAVPLRN